MKKEEYIRKYGEVAYDRMLQQNRDWKVQHPDEAKANHQEVSQKGGKYYEKWLKYNHTGLQGERSKIRRNHARLYYPYKQVISPNSQIHHEWIPGTADFRGVALVETDQHMHGYIDVIKILDGKITLFTEKEIGEQK